MLSATNLKIKLNELANQLYPKNITGLDEMYNKTIEIKKLISECKLGISKNEMQFKKLKDFFSKQGISFIDKTSYFINEPSFILQVKSVNMSYNIYLSFLIPYLYISEFKENSDSYRINPDYINGIDINEISSKINYSIFPKELLNEIIPNISFEEIPFGSFTFKNAFFNNYDNLI